MVNNWYVAANNAWVKFSSYSPVAVTVPTAPTSFAADPDVSLVTLTWSEPTSTGNSPITSYRVSRNGVAADGAAAFSMTVPATTKTYTFTKLVNGTAYAFTVEALNTKGASPVATVTATPTAPPTTTVPTYGITDNTGASLRKDVYLPSQVTRTHVGPNLYATGSGWSSPSGGGTYTSAGDRYVLGDRSMKYITNGIGTTAVMQRAIPTMDVSKGKVLRMLVYIDDASSISQMGIHLASNGSSTMSDSVIRLLDNRFYVSGWQTLTFNVGEMAVSSGTFNPASLNYMKVNIKDSGTSTSTQPVEVQINAIWTETTSPITKGAVCFTFDDGYASGYSTVFPLMTQYNMKGTLYVMPGNFNQGSTWLLGSQVKEMNNAGWTIGAHAWNSGDHKGMTGSTLETSIDKTREWLNTNTGNADHFAYWDGLDYTNGAVRDILAARFKSVRANKGSQVSLESAWPSRPQQMRSWLAGSEGAGYTAPYPGTVSAGTGADWINRCAIKSNGLAIFTWHNVGSDLSVSTFETFLKYAADARDAGDIEVLTIAQAMSRIAAP